ncbi:MAG TPA: hypothetical protein VGE99_13705 [Candidatus Dormibacteraeota bacterium]
MDHYSAEKWMLERHRGMVQTAERQSRLGAPADLPLRAWAAGCLRSLADRLDGAARLESAGNVSPHIRLRIG